MAGDYSVEKLFCGTVTVGERGQVVIPADARRRFNINPGDKIIVMGHPSGEGVMLFRIESLREFLNGLMQGLSRVDDELKMELSAK